MTNVFEVVREKINEIGASKNIGNSGMSKKDIEREAAIKLANAWVTIMADPRYPEAMRLLNRLREKLTDNMHAVLAGQSGGYSREERTDRAAMISAQVVLLEYLVGEPDRIIAILNSKDKGE